MDVCMVVSMDRWMIGEMDRYMGDRYMDGKMYGWMGRCLYGCMVVSMDGCLYGCIDG